MISIIISLLISINNYLELNNKDNSANYYSNFSFDDRNSNENPEDIIIIPDVDPN